MDRQNRNVVGTGGGSGKRLGGGGTVHPGYGSLRRAAYRIIRYVCFFFSSPWVSPSRPSSGISSASSA